MRERVLTNLVRTGLWRLESGAFCVVKCKPLRFVKTLKAKTRGWQVKTSGPPRERGAGLAPETVIVITERVCAAAHCSLLRRGERLTRPCLQAVLARTG